MISCFSHLFTKNKIFYSIVGAFSAFFAPIQCLFLWVCFFVIADLITGIWTSKKLGIKIESRKMYRTFEKIGLFVFLIICFHSIDYSILNLNVGLAKYVCGALLFNELYSILENFYKITNNRVFYILTQFTLKKAKELTGVELNGKN